MPERMEQADRERLRALKAYDQKYGDDGIMRDESVSIDDALDGCVIAKSALGIECAFYEDAGRMHAWARQEIARLEALEHAEATPTVAPDPGWDAHKFTTWTGDSLIVEHGLGVRPSATWSWTIRRGKAPPIVFHPSDLAALEADLAEPAAPTEQRLDDFMRDRDEEQRKDRMQDFRQRTLNRIMAEPINTDHGVGDRQPASRELVERMVREATAHSVWPVTLEVPDPREPTGYHVMFHRPDGGSAIALEYGALSRHAAGEAESMATLIEACEIMRVCVRHHNAKACPACNGHGKTRGYFFGEKQCPDCEGTGVR